MNNIFFKNNKVIFQFTLKTAILLFAVSTAMCQTKVSHELNNEIDAYLSEVMTTHGIPGMAVAIIKDNQLLYKTYLGSNKKDDLNDPINRKTTFRLYSLSKIMSSVGVFKLIETGALSLENKLSDYFDNLPIAWQNITIKHLLSHTSGLPDVHEFSTQLADESLSDPAFIKLLYPLQMDFISGNEWRYNQTNFLLLKLIIEKASQMKFEEFILSNQFGIASPADVYFLSDPSIKRPKRAHYYSFNIDKQVFETKNEHIGSRNHPLSGLNITLDEFISWNNKLDADELISSQSKANMWSEAEINDSDRRFLYGWDIYQLNNHDSYGFSGGGVSGYRKFIDDNISIIVLMTGYKYYSMQDSVIDHLAGLIDNSLKNEESVLIETIMDRYFLTADHADILTTVLAVKAAYPMVNLEKTFKSIGYKLFFDMNQKEQAIELNQFNVLLYPLSFDTYGTLGYLYFLNEQYSLAKLYYSKALELNPQNNYSRKRLLQIEEQLNNAGAQ